MAGWLLIIVILSVAGWAALQVRQGGTVFIVRIRGGAARRVSGTVSAEFLTVVEELCGAHGIDRGEIRGVPHGRFIRLKFSHEFPFGFCQELRNWWASTV